MINNKNGSAFIIVIAVLGIILFSSSLFMTSTIQEGKNTAMSVKGLHATCLAQAAIERTMKILVSQSNDLDIATTPKDSLAVLLRLPAPIKSGASIAGLGDNLGADELLDLNADVTKEIVFTKADLQSDDTKNDLDRLVNFITNDGVKEYKIEVKVKVDKAFRVSPGKTFPTYKVPGVEIPWNLRPDVESFLEGGGYSPFTLRFPSTMSWLSFSIPIKIGGITLININVATIVDEAIKAFLPGGIPVGGGQKVSFKTLTSLDFFAEKLINGLFKAQNGFKYPFQIKFDKIQMPATIAELWPSGTSVTGANDTYLEKYGQLNLECEASITYNDGYTSKRRVYAVKDFKVADCEPPASMYSLFISNLANKYLAFNNYGGQFIVNNFDYSGSWGKIKELFTAGADILTQDEMQTREVPGLIRVNYRDDTQGGDEVGNKPLVINVGLMGDWGSPDMANTNDGMAKKVFSGIESFLILSSKLRMAVAGGSYNVNASVVGRVPSNNTNVPPAMAPNTPQPPSPVKLTSKHGLLFQNQATNSSMKPSDLLQKLAGGGKINLVPNVGGMSTNVIALAITLALKPMVDSALSALPTSSIMMPDCYQKWDMAYMGTSNMLYTIPTHGVGMNKTHLFGSGALHPTLTREIEGNVLKKYRQWKMCIVGMDTLDRLPLLPFPPPACFVPPPPLVVPIWYSCEVLTKYGYNLETLQARKADKTTADTKTHEYDPAKMANMPPNLYTSEQYVKKAAYYYEDFPAFTEDYKNRLVNLNGKDVFLLNGVTYISDTMGDPGKPFDPNGDGKFYVTGKGMIVCSGNLYLGCDIEMLDESTTKRTIYSTIVRDGGLLIMNGNKKHVIEGSLYTDRGIYLNADSSLRIIGNWVTNSFSKAAMGGKIIVDYVSSKVRSSLGSLHPERGKFDPTRYHVSFSPLWSSWREN